MVTLTSTARSSTAKSSTAKSSRRQPPASERDVMRASQPQGSVSQRRTSRSPESQLSGPEPGRPR